MTLALDIPKHSVSYAANCTASFARVCGTIGLAPKLEHIRYEKKYGKKPKSFLWVGMRLDSGRFSGLYKEEDEDYFRIYLQMRKRGFYLSDLDEVSNFINVDKSSILRLDNDLKWIKSERGEEIDFPIVRPAPGAEDGLVLLKKMWADAGVKVDMDKLEAEIRAGRSKKNGDDGK